MVAQQNSGICKRIRNSRKENILFSDRLRHSERSFWRKIDTSLSIFRQRVQTRVHRCQELLERIDRNSRQMRLCFLQLMDMVEKSKTLVNDEKEGNMQLLQLLDDCYTGKRHISSKTQTVTPMIYGIPLKKASISLRRLNPFLERQNQNTSSDIADSSPAVDVGFSRPNASTPLHENLDLQRVSPPSAPPSPQVPSLSQSSASSSFEDEYFSDELQGHRGRERRRHKTSTRFLSSSGQEFRLKKASISLKRLDPQSYLPETESLNTKMPFPRSGSQSDVLGSVCRTTTHERNTETENTRARHICTAQKCMSCFPAPQDPLVVLTRLRSFPSSCELNIHDQDIISQSASSGVFSVQENCRNKSKKNHEERQKSKSKHERANCISPETEISTCSIKKRKLGDPACIVSMKTTRLDGRVNLAKKTTETNDSSTEVKKKYSGNVKKKDEIVLPANTTSKEDEDPLEGPSWLYKDGTKREKLKSLKKIRKSYLTPIYYLAPTIYSSSDESGNETAVDRRTTKLRKKKPKKRS